MPNEKPFANEFEVGVMTALQYIGMVLARTPGIDKELMKSEIELLQSRLPETPKWPGIEASPSRAPLKALLKGLD